MTPRYFPFEALGLRRNPFGALTREEWADVAVLPAPVRELLARGFDHLQLLGARGRGKTTHLLALARHFTEAGERVAYERLPPGQRRYQTDLAGLDRFLLDEAQRLDPRARGRLLRAARGGLRLALGSHTDLRRAFARHGLALTIRQIAQAASPDHLAAILARRVAWFALDDPPRVSFSPGAVAYLHRVFGDDLRAIENHLYHVFQALDTPRALTAADVARPGDPADLSPEP